MKQVAVSILIPVYCVPEMYLKRNIENCIQQTLRDIEIIIVDDGSTDNSGKICDEYARKDSRIKVFHQKNRGLSSARNRAFDKASGRYVMFVDGDDYIDKTCCKKAYTLAQEEGCEVLGFGFNRDSYGKVISCGNFPKERICFQGTNCRELQVKVLDETDIVSSVCGKLYQREFLVSNNVRHIDGLKMGAEGFVFTMRVFEKTSNVLFVPERYYFYTFNEKSISKSPNIEKGYMALECYHYIRTEIIEHSVIKEQLMKAYYYRVCFTMIWATISIIFSPYNKMRLKERRRELINFCSYSECTDTIANMSTEKLDAQRKIIWKLIKHRCCYSLYGIGILRYIRKKLGK